MSIGRDRELGLHRQISRRDFVGGVSVALTGSVLGACGVAALEWTSQLEQELARLDVANLTPLEAINKLYELQKKAQGSQDKGDHARGSGG